jgi:hypothetical protein
MNKIILYLCIFRTKFDNKFLESVTFLFFPKLFIVNYGIGLSFTKDKKSSVKE